MDSIATAYPVYLGVWINWSYGRVLGSTLTLTRSDGTLLIAFVAFFVTVVGTQIWRILAFILHRYLSSSKSEDALYHQRQVVLRNSASPIKTMSLFLKMLTAWRTSTAKVRPIKRLLPLILGTLLVALALTAASGFSSRVARGSEVLIDGSRCGLIRGSDFSNNMTAMTELLDPYNARQTEQATDYAQRCYESKSSSNECGTFIRPALPVKVTPDAKCPFDDSICAVQDSNIVVDSGYLDSHSDLGLNWPQNARFQMRYQMQCAPLVTEGYRSKWVFANTTFMRYQYGDGSVPPSDCNCTIVVNMDRLGTGTKKEDPPAFGPNQDYGLMSLFADFHNGSLMEGSYLFEPIAELSGHDGDLIVNFLYGNAVVFLEPSPDPWYKATTPTSLSVGTSEEMGGEANVTSYEADEPAWPMGCVVQYEVCKDNICTGLGPSMTTFLSMRDNLHINSTFLSSAFYWNLMVPTGNILATMGRTSLASRYQYTNGMQSGITSKSWQLDVIHWFSTSLASLQLQLAEVASGPHIDGHTGLEDFVTTPDANERQDHCGSQKIRSTAYTSFSMFGLLFVFISGTLIMVIAAALEPLAFFFEKRFRKLNGYASLEWRANHVLQLHHMAHEDLSPTEWTLGLFDIPTTRDEHTLAVLEKADAKDLPRLLKPADNNSINDHTNKYGSEQPALATDDIKLDTYQVESNSLNVDSPLTVTTGWHDSEKQDDLSRQSAQVSPIDSEPRVSMVMMTEDHCLPGNKTNL